MFGGQPIGKEGDPDIIGLAMPALTRDADAAAGLVVDLRESPGGGPAVIPAQKVDQDQSAAGVAPPDLFHTAIPALSVATALAPQTRTATGHSSGSPGMLISSRFGF